jgi:hypothetical protein
MAVCRPAPPSISEGATLLKDHIRELSDRVLYRRALQVEVRIKRVVSAWLGSPPYADNPIRQRAVTADRGLVLPPGPDRRGAP